MARAKRGFKRRRRVKGILDRAEGFVLGRKNLFRRAAEAVDWSLVYAYRDRKRRKRDFRNLWITRIGAAAVQNGTSYSQLLGAMKKNSVALNRKVLAELAIHDPMSFSEIVRAVS